MTKEEFGLVFKLMKQIADANSIWINGKTYTMQEVASLLSAHDRVFGSLLKDLSDKYSEIQRHLASKTEGR